MILPSRARLYSLIPISATATVEIAPNKEASITFKSKREKMETYAYTNQIFCQNDRSGYEYHEVITTLD